LLPNQGLLAAASPSPVDSAWKENKRRENSERQRRSQEKGRTHTAVAQYVAAHLCHLLACSMHLRQAFGGCAHV
jgi:hypothetical protein